VVVASDIRRVGQIRLVVREIRRLVGALVRAGAALVLVPHGALMSAPLDTRLVLVRVLA
jgi:hypothetical protein